MRKTTNYGLSLYDKEDKLNITAEENSLNANMQIIDKTLKEKATISDMVNYIEEHKDELKGDKGDTGADGYTPIKGVDYFDGKDGINGKDGQDGKDGLSGVYVGSGEMPEDCNVQIDPDGETNIIPTKTSQLENDSDFATEQYVDNAIANIDIPSGEEGGSGGGNASAFSVILVTEEPTNAVDIELPVDLNKALHFNVHMTFPNLESTFALYSVFGNKYAGWNNVPPSANSGANIYAVKYDIARDYFAAGFTTAKDYPANSRPSIGNAAICVPKGSDKVRFYSSTEGVLLPEGTTFEIWGVCEI